ncbi:MAG: type II toxin-antitoxin system Phd/YefM family antitoxin [Gaiellaceae bacterium]
MATRMGIRELRDTLTTAIRRVRAGESIEVTHDGEPVALITPIPKTSLERLIAEGRATRGRVPLRLPDLVEPLPGTPTSEEIFADDRGD